MIARRRPLQHSLLVLLGTLGAYMAYAVLVVPRIEGNGFTVTRDPSQAHVAATEVATGQHHTLQDLPADGWEHQSSKRLEVEEGIVFFQDYRQREDGSIEVFPFTLILKKGAPAYGAPANVEEPPIVVRASQHAVLKFDRPFVMGTSSSGKLTECLLEGDVNIYRQNPEIADRFNLWTRNVQLTPQRIVSLDEVRFEVGAHSGIGRNLILDLEHKTSAAALSSSFTTVTGIARLELAFVDRIRILPNPDAGAEPGASSSLAQAPIEITCAGPFVVDFTEKLAEFRDQVQVTRIDSIRDQITANRLRLFFSTTSETPDQTPQNGFRLTKVQLEGAPAQLQMTSENASAVGELLEYDLVKQEILGNDPHQVQLRQGDKRFAAPKLRYALRPDGGLGTLLAEGAGELEQIPATNTPEDSFILKWSDFMSSQDVQGRKLITIAGKVSATINQQATVEGDKLELWLIEKASVVPDREPSNPRWEYYPSELLVDNHVRLSTSELTGRSRLLKLIWPNPNQIQVSRGATTETSRLGNGWHNQQYRVLRPGFWQEGTPFPPMPADSTGFLAPAAGNQPSDPQLPGETPSRGTSNPRTKPKLSVDSDLITVQLATSPSEKPFRSNRHVRQVELDGHVVVTQPRADPSADPEFRITGNKLQLVPQDGELYQAHVWGDARVETDPLSIQGRDLHLDQHANRIWVDGPGSLVARQSPNADVGKEPSLSPQPPAMDHDHPIHVEWQAGMIFDGEKVYFEENVRCRTRQQNENESTFSLLRSRSEGLSLQLNQHLNLADLDQQAPAPSEVTISQIVLVNELVDRAFPAFKAESPTESVVLERTVFGADQKQQARQLMVVPQISVDLQSGEIRAMGPGRLLGWNKSEKDAGASKFSLASAEKNRQAPSAALQFLQATFQNRLNANTKSERVLLTGHVQAIHGGVGEWTEQLDPEAPRVVGNAAKLKCDQVEVARWQPRGSANLSSEIRAEGNVHIESEQFEASAHRLTYEEESDMLTIEGDERTAATLWQKKARSSAANQLSARKIRYRPSDEWTSIDDMKKATVRDLPPGR